MCKMTAYSSNLEAIADMISLMTAYTENIKSREAIKRKSVRNAKKGLVRLTVEQFLFVQ